MPTSSSTIRISATAVSSAALRARVLRSRSRAALAEAPRLLADRVWRDPREPSPVGFPTFDCGQRDHGARPGRAARKELEPPPVPLCDVLRVQEPEPNPVSLRGVEGVEDLAAVLRRGSRALVRDLDL